MKLLNLLKKEISQQELLNYYNTTISFEKLPDGINGFVFSYQGIKNIMINNNLSYYMKKTTIIHELAHIELNHLEQADNDLIAFKVSKQEDEADIYIKFIIENIEG